MSYKWLSAKEIGDRVREVRDTLGGITQKELAQRVNRPGSQSVISEIEREERAPEPGILLDIAALVGRGLEYFQEDPTKGERERAEKLIAARWMEKIATQLRAEATPVRGPAEAVDAGERGMAALDEGRRGGKKRRSGKGGK